MNAAEERLSNQLLAVIRHGVKAGLPPDAVRTAFENALREFMTGAKK